MDCIFCKIVHKDIPSTILYEDHALIAIADIHPKADTHLLVLPKRHIPTLNDFNIEDADLISHLLLNIPKIAQSQGLSDGYRVVNNVGIRGGQEIFHLHFHVLGGPDLPGF